MSNITDEEICPKCNKEKYPFDVTCDACFELSIAITETHKPKAIRTLNTLGYSYREQYGTYNFPIELMIKVHRDDSSELESIVKEALDT